MREAGHDTNRLVLLDLASPVRVKMLQFMDDNPSKVPCKGVLCDTISSLTGCIGRLRAQLAFKKGGTEYRERGLMNQLPIPCGGGNVQCSDVRRPRYHTGRFSTIHRSFVQDGEYSG